MDGELNILIIEDNPADAELAERELKKGGFVFSMKRVEREEPFLREIQEFKPDVIIADYSLPGYSGMEALRAAIDHAPFTPFIIFTGSISEEVAVECIKAGAWDYVIKEHITRLVPAVRSALEKRSIIEEKEMATEAVRRSENKYRTIFNASPAAIVLLDRSGKVLDANASIGEMTGYAPGEIIKRHVADLPYVPAADRPKIAESFRKRIEGGDVPPYETDLIKKNGEGMVGRVVGSVMRDEDGEISGAVIVISDVTECKRTEKNMEELAKFPEENPYPVLRVDRDGRVLYANASSDVLMNSWGKKVGDFVPDKWRNTTLDVFTTGGRRVLEEKVEKKDFLFMFAPIVDAGYMNIYANDITEVREAEKELKETIAQLQRFKEVTVDREEKMIELKKEINKLYSERGEKEPYDVSFAEHE